MIFKDFFACSMPLIAKNIPFYPSDPVRTWSSPGPDLSVQGPAKTGPDLGQCTSKPSNAVDGHTVMVLDGCSPSRPPSVQMVNSSSNGTGTATVRRIRPTREVRVRCAALVV